MSKQVIDGVEAWEGRNEGDWVWCLHCGQAYRLGEYRNVYSKSVKGYLQMCPYPGCDGNTVLDSVPWEAMASNGHPIEPIRGVVYQEGKIG